MLFVLFLVFTIVPLLELALLIYIGSKTSVLFTIGLVLLMGILGATLARWQGWQALTRIRYELRAGRMPADAMLDGLLILVAGVLLVTPGVLTDVVGFSFLIPPVRKVVKRALIAWLRRNVRVDTVQFRSVSGSGADRTPVDRDQNL
jgi:UPF0716 protein FxsA